MPEVEREWVQPEDRAAWRAWLDRNHATSPGAWVVTWRATSGRAGPRYEDVVEEALCFGWIDSKGGKVDEHRTRLLVAPRRRGSGWSRPNKQRIERLEAAGSLEAAGRDAVAAARADGSWSRLDAVEDLVVPDDLAAAFDVHPGSRARWEGFPPSARRAALEWIATAKRPATRAGRVQETAVRAARGERAR